MTSRGGFCFEDSRQAWSRQVGPSSYFCLFRGGGRRKGFFLNFFTHSRGRLPTVPRGGREEAATIIWVLGSNFMEILSSRIMELISIFYKA